MCSEAVPTRRQIPLQIRNAGIGQKAYYRVPIHLQPAMRDYAPRVDLPATTEVARTHLAIPMSPVLTAEQAAEVTDAVRAFSGAAV